MLDLPQVTQEVSTSQNTNSNKSLSWFRYNRDEGWLTDSFQINSTTPLLSKSCDESPRQGRSIRSRLPKLKPALPIFIFGLVIGVTGIFSLFSYGNIKTCNDRFMLMFVRHCEKNKGIGISSRGKCRADLMPSLFNGKTLPEPQMLATFAPSIKRPSLRGVETLLPISNKLNIEINTWTSSLYENMLEYVLARACGRTVLIAWHHNVPNILNITLDLGVNYDVANGLFAIYGKDYNAVWMVSYNGENIAPNITIKSEGLGKNPCKSLEV